MTYTLLQVALGGALGAMARYLVGLGALRAFGPGFPYGTFAINVLGSGAIGVLAVLLAEREGGRLAPFLITGVLGGFTTFSAFSLESVLLLQRGAVAAAGLYILGSVALSLAGTAAGIALAKGSLG